MAAPIPAPTPENNMMLAKDTKLYIIVTSIRVKCDTLEGAECKFII